MASDKHETAHPTEHPAPHAGQHQPPPAAAKAPAGAPAPDPKAAAELKEAMAAASIGAQVILDFNEDASLGARGGAGADITENTMARDMRLVAMGLDPVSPVGPPPTPEALKARREAEAKAANAQLAAAPPSGKATRVSSLAAGINSGDVPAPPNDPPPAREA